MSELVADRDVPAPPDSVAPGEPLAPGYVAIALLRRGRSLDVYDAWSQERGCRCVFKSLRPGRSSGRRDRALLRREGRLLTELSHPHLVRGYELLERPGTGPAIVMETLTGETLAHLIERRRARLSWRDLAHLALHIGTALRYLHGHGIVHLDVKPSNVIAEAGRAKLIDLSLARPPGVVSPGVGTWCYLSPEQARGGEVGPATDVWGLGVLLFEAATAELPFEDPNGGWTSAAGDESSGVYDGAYPQLSQRAPAVGGLRRLPSVLSGLIDGCLEPDPAARPQLAEVLATAEPLTGLPAEQRRWSGGGGRPPQ